VVALVLFWLWSKNDILLRQPTTFYQSSDGLDYSDNSNWYRLPDQTKDGALNVFVIYPTVVADSTQTYYIDNSDAAIASGVAVFMEQSIEPLFDGLNVNIYVPKYRPDSVDFYNDSFSAAFLTVSALAQADIYNAFDYFLWDINKNQDFMIIGHSQGAALGALLVSDFAKHYMPLTSQQKMKLAILPGWGLTNTVLDDSPYQISAAPDDQNTILSWNTATEQEVQGDYSRLNWGDATTLATNPTTFTNAASDIAEVVRPLDQGGNFRGEVLLTHQPAEDYTTPAVGAQLDKVNLGFAHPYDISLFIEPLRDNLRDRLGI
jgi:hypothetical protein